MKRYSFSLLSLKCPRRIHKTMSHDRVEVLPQEETDIGRQTHYELASILSQPKEQRNFELLKNILEIYGDTERAFSKIKGRIETEKKIRIRIGKHTFTVVLDTLVARRGERDIIDHKTTFAKQIHPAYIEQLEDYSVPFLRKGLKVNIAAHLVRWGRIEWISVLQGLEDYTRITNRILKQINTTKEILNEKPIPIPSNFECTYCPFIISCPVGPKFFILDNKDAAKLAREYIKLVNKVKAIKKFLEIYCSRVGTIYLEDSKIGYSYRNKTVIDETPLLKFMKKYKIPITDAFSAKTLLVKKLARKYEDIANYVEILPDPIFKISKLEMVEKEMEVRRFVLLDEEEKQKTVKKALKEAKKYEEILRFVDIGDIGGEE